MNRVLVFTDVPLLAAGLIELARNEPGVEIVGQAREPAEAAEMIAGRRPDIVVLAFKDRAAADLAWTQLKPLTLTGRIRVLGANLDRNDVWVYSRRSGKRYPIRSPEDFFATLNRQTSPTSSQTGDD